MPNYAYAHVMGHLGQDPETRHLPDGTPVVTFSVATSRKRKDEELTTWWRCSLFGRRGEVLAQYLRKGDPVLVRGEPYLQPWTAQDGTQRTSLKMLCDSFAFVGGKGQAQQPPAPDAQQPPDAQQAPAPAAGGTFDDDIPF